MCEVTRGLADVFGDVFGAVCQTVFDERIPFFYTIDLRHMMRFLR